MLTAGSRLSVGVALLLHAALPEVALAAEYPPFSALGSPNRNEPSEDKRVEQFERLHGAWPPPRVYPGGRPRAETDKWARRMEEIEDRLRSAEDPRWEGWLDLAQMRLLANFTPSGWSVGEMDPGVHRELSEHFAKRGSVVPETTNRNSELLITGIPDFWDPRQNVPRQLIQRLEESIQRKLAEWVGMRPEQLRETSTYGIRIYKRDSVLKMHVDHLETHVLSAVYCVDVQGEDKDAEPWYLGAFPDISGEDAKVDLRPGQLFFYESAKLPHARPGVFHGDSYAAMFVHFMPVDWDLTRFDRVYALPPGWANPRRSDL